MIEKLIAEWKKSIEENHKLYSQIMTMEDVIAWYNAQSTQSTQGDAK